MKKTTAIFKAGIILLVIAAIIVIVYGSVAIATFSRADVKVYDGGKPSASPVEIIYNSLMFTDGSYRYGIQVYVDADSVTAGVSSAVAEAQIKEAVSRKLKAISDRFTEAGMRVDYDEEEFFVNAVLAEYSGAEEMSIANGETGYDVGTSSGTVYNGFFFSDYVVSYRTAFADAEADNYLNYVYGELTADGLISSSDMDFVFNYGTAYSTKLIESDADYVYLFKSPDGKQSYVHEFRMSVGEREREITLVQHSPNTASWYLIVITAALIVTGVTFVVVGIKRAREN